MATRINYAVLASVALGLALMVSGGVLLLSPWGSPSAADAAVKPAQVEYAAPEFHASDLSGRSVRLAQYSGRVVLVNLWATWCPPCRKEMPALRTFHDEYAAAGFAAVAINQGESSRQVLEFVRRYSLTFPIWIDPGSEAERVFGTISLPSTFIIDREGMVRLVWIGEFTKDGLEKYVVPLLADD